MNYAGQCQPFCTKRSYCDFVVWTKKEVHIERIHPHESFWLENVSKLKPFFVTSILPELIGKFYSRTAKSQVPSISGPSSSALSLETDGIPAKNIVTVKVQRYGWL